MNEVRGCSGAMHDMFVTSDLTAPTTPISHTHIDAPTATPSFVGRFVPRVHIAHPIASVRMFPVNLYFARSESVRARVCSSSACLHSV